MKDSALLRGLGLALVALAVWFVCYAQSQPHRIVAADAPATTFSAMRAETVLTRLLGPERPHPVGSAENAAVRGRILTEFAKLGVHARTYRAFTCNTWRSLSYVSCATVTDIIADAIPGDGKAIVLLAHYDSVPAGPGASDDESGVATVLETVRALKARGGTSLHPVLAVITDGEEAGLLGANAFLQNAALKSRVGAVVNVEARGTKGLSLLFQTSPGDGRLIDLYARSVPVYATSSLYAEIYKVLPNDTDLTLFIRDGFPSFNFAFADNVRYYHSPFDIRANLDPATLQMQGDNMLGVAGALEATEFVALKGGNDVYLTLPGGFLPRMQASWALPLSILAFFAIAWAAWRMRRGEASGRRGLWIASVRPLVLLLGSDVLIAAAMPLTLLVGCALSGWLLSFVAQILSGHPDPTYAHPLAMRVALGFAVWAMTLLVSRMARLEAAAAAAWLWIAVLGVITAAFLPGLSPYFVFPALVAAVLLPVAALAPGRWSGGFGQIALFVAALAALFVWFPLVVSGETLMGLRLHPLFTIPAAFALMTVAPLIDSRGNTGAILCGVAALVMAVIAGLQPAYSKASPQRVNLVYFENDDKPARWMADTSWKAVGTEPIPSALQKAGPFVRTPDAWDGLMPGDAYTAPAGSSVYPLPAATVIADRRSGAVRTVNLAVHASPLARGMILSIPKDADLVSLDLRGQHFEAQGWHGDVRLFCLTSDCRDLRMTLVLGDKGAVSLPFAEVRYGLPDFGARFESARPIMAMASQSGDEALLANVLKLAPR